MELNYDKIGIKIQKLREYKKISQAELGDIINSTERHVRRIEGGHCGISLNLLVSIANALNASVDDILGDNLQYTPIDTEFHGIMHGCTPAEKTILMDMLKHMKALLQEHGI